MKANSNNQEIFMLIDNLSNELIQYDKSKHTSIIENYSKDPAFKFLLDQKWRSVLESRINMCTSNVDQDTNLEKKKSRFDMMKPTNLEQNNDRKSKNETVIINPENLPAGVIATMVKTKFTKVKFKY